VVLPPFSFVSAFSSSSYFCFCVAALVSDGGCVVVDDCLGLQTVALQWLFFFSLLLLPCFFLSLSVFLFFFISIFFPSLFCFSFAASLPDLCSPVFLGKKLGREAYYPYPVMA